MTLKERDAFAERCGTSARHLANVAYGYKPCGEGLAIQIEKHSERAVLCEDMRPDVEWAVIRATPKTPKPTRKAA